MIDLIHIQNQILTYLRGGQYADESLERDTDLIESGLLDSMLVMDLVHFIELQYSMSLEPTDITPRNLRTVTDMARCIAGKSAAGKAA